MNYFILEIGQRFNAWHISDNKPYKLNTREIYTVEPALHLIRKVKAGDDDSVTFLLHKYATAVDVGHISGMIGHVLQCSPDFTYHDAMYKAATWGSALDGTTLGIVDTGISSFSETMSFYINGKVVLRSFGVNKSLEVLTSYLLAEAKLADIAGWHSIDKADARKVELEAKKIAKKMHKDIVDISRMKSEYDVLAFQGASIAWRVECNKIAKRLMREVGKNEIDGGIISLYVLKIVETVMMGLLEGFKFDNLVLTGDLFKRSWVVAIIKSMTQSNVYINEEVHPGMGMYATYLEEIEKCDT